MPLLLYPLLLLASAPLAAASPEMDTPPLLAELSVLAGLSLLPFAVMLLTSYVKIIIVLSLLRNALGVQQSPPNQLLNGIALLMTLYVMFPTGVAMWDAASGVIGKDPPQQLLSAPTARYIIDIADHAKEPLRAFLLRNTLPQHRKRFFQLAQRSFPAAAHPGLQDDSFIVAVPAYVTSQLRAAFQIGMLVYLPFFVIDIVTSNILMAMGMIMLSPLVIALPLKLLLIVMVDGWTLLLHNLVLTFK